ncbi:MAG: hypothetical protein JJV95_06690 [Sulfurospirillum sp.]|nr:hypothetical protein [Sulfurospirillum sp.]MBL0703649.1 hypothetical protein [Sulfurospirillum sp.]
MSRFLLIFLLLFGSLFGIEKSNWTHTHRYTLKKDEIIDIKFHEIKPEEMSSSTLFFSWTTIVEDRVTILLNHKGYPHQYILYNKRSLDRVKFNILPDRGNRIEDKTYLVLVLSNIDGNKQEVEFDIFIKDNKNRILVEF